jgi:hypothetical protein
MRRTLRIALVGVLTLVMCFDSATACHFLRGRWGGHRGWGGSYCHAPMDYAGPCCGVAISSDGCGGEVLDGEYVDEYYDGAVVIEGETLPAEEAQAPEAPREQRPAETFRPMDRDVAPTLPPDSRPAERAMPPAQEDELFAPAEEPMPMEPPPVAEPPAEEPADELFAPPAETAPPPATPPAEVPAETPPAETEPTNDLFGVGTEEAAPAETPPAEPADTAPAEEPAEEPTDTDLFGGAAEEEATDAPAEETPAEEEAPAEEATPPAAEETEDEGGLFEFGAILGEPGGLASGEMRQWVDNTGQYSVNGRLVRFLDGKVRLLKENGRTTTVPLSRLSQSDLEFVHRQASAQQAEVMGHTAQASTMLPLLAN